ncbi:beta-1,4-endoglucanase, partial [Aphelenchoides avenae]
WLWEFYNQRDSTAPLTTYNGFEGAQFLIHNNLEIGCAIRQGCENNTQVVVCAYRNRAAVASEVYPRGVACATDADCTFYPAKCLQDGLCDLKSQPPPFGQLSVNGNKLVGENGQTVRLRGMSMWGTNKYNRDRFYNIDTVRALKCNWRTNVVRAVIDPGTNGTGRDDPSEPPKAECSNCGGGYIWHTRQQFRQPEGNVDLQIFERVVKAAIEVGIYVILDWHGIYTPTFWQPSARQFFTYVANKYKVFPHVLYETFNEPASKEGVAHVDAWAKEIKPYHEMIIPVIRQFDKKNVIILGTPEYSGQPQVVVSNPISIDSNIAYTWHFYMAKPRQPFDGTGRQAAVRSVLDSNRLVFVTEYGTTDGSGRTNYNPEAMKQWWAFMDEVGLSYTNWAVNDASWDGTGAPYPTGTSAFTTPTNGSEVGLDSHLTPSGKLVKEHIGKDNGVPQC